MVWIGNEKFEKGVDGCKSAFINIDRCPFWHWLILSLFLSVASLMSRLSISHFEKSDNSQELLQNESDDDHRHHQQQTYKKTLPRHIKRFQFIFYSFLYWSLIWKHLPSQTSNHVIMKIQLIITLLILSQITYCQTQELDSPKDNPKTQCGGCCTPFKKTKNNSNTWFEDTFPELVNWYVPIFLIFCFKTCLIYIIILVFRREILVFALIIVCVPGWLIYYRWVRIYRVYYSLLEEFNISHPDRRDDVAVDADANFFNFSYLEDIELNPEDFEVVLRLFRRAHQDSMRNGNITSRTPRPHRTHG